MADDHAVAAGHAGTMRTISTTNLWRGIAIVMGLQAASLAVMSVLHLSGTMHDPGQSVETDAGVAEALICVVLACGAGVLARRGAAGRMAALGATGFAIIGFGIGLSITASSGYLPDIVYHSTVLPTIIAAFLLLLVAGKRESADVPVGVSR